MKTKTYASTDAEERLAQLGLDGSVLKRAVIAGQLAFASCTKNDPPNLPGTLAIGRTTRELRELLAGEGWRRREGAYSLTVNPKLGVAVSVYSGSSGTGRLDQAVRTKNPKGPKAAIATQVNRQQLVIPLFGAQEESSETEPKVTTWVLLVARDHTSVRSELSLPAVVNDDGVIVGWAERIALPDVQLGSDVVEVAPEETHVDIEVARKTL